MHELSLVQQVVDICVKKATINNAVEIKCIKLIIGKLYRIEKKWFKRYFDYMTKNTIACGAQIKIIEHPIIAECLKCSWQFEMKGDIDRAKCDSCQSKKIKIIKGNEFQIEDIEVI